MSQFDEAKLHISRRKFILAGLSAAPLARVVTGAHHCIVTEDNILGPFYRVGSPWRTTLFDTAEVSNRLIVTGRVVDAENCTALIGAVLDVWQANAKGSYSEPPNYHLRGKLRTDHNGNFSFLTIIPGNYREKSARKETPWMRAQHIHFIVSHPAYQPLTTQCYLQNDRQNDQYLASDRYVKRSQIVRLTKSNTRTARFEATFNIALEKIEGLPKVKPR